ncbi:MAG TPA: S8 family serine peptidase, partial [Acidimicrobiia bacterium]|nr:S8 family serine peptidase [Acidimicrobiia bacterium]
TTSSIAAAPLGTSPLATAPDGDLGGQPADYLGLPEGLWARLGGPEQAGEGVIVGVIDTGIYPEHPSFADQPLAADGTRNYIGPAYGPPPAGWRGICQAGENFPATSCNNKLIGARYFAEGWGVANVAAQDFLSPRDADGHGTGMTAIAAGNYGVDPDYQGNDLGLGVISGLAPRARIATYKALWAIPAFDGSGFGADSDLVAAIDAAVADGVDVLNLSIGGPIDLPPFSDRSTLRDPVALALLGAFDAGVVSVLAAGNDGPTPETIESPGHSPWVISAGSSGLPTNYTATATVSGGPDGPTVTARGISPTPALGTVPLIDGGAAAAPGADLDQAQRCRPGSLDPALVRGKAVLCRLGNALVASATLSGLGAAGAVFHLSNFPYRYTTLDVWLPSVVVSQADGAAIRQLMASAPNPTVSLTAGTLTPATTGDYVVYTSARGPTFGSPNLLKPDVLAPGEDIITAQTPEVPVGTGGLFDFSQPGNRFRPLGGTSLSTANVAGAAALLRALHPAFGPGEVKSALMTTAQPAIVEDDADNPSVPAAVTDIGAGRIDPNRAADPGLLLSETGRGFADFLRGESPTRDLTQPAVNATDLNLPSIAFEPLVGHRSTRRTFTGADDTGGAWNISFEGLAGIAATAQPARFSIEPGQRTTVEFSFDPGTAPVGTSVGGAAILTNEQDGRTVRLPIVVRPEVFEAPDQLNFGAAEAAGRAPLPVPTGYSGQLSALGYGLARPETFRDQTVGQNTEGGDADVSQPRVGVTVFDLQVPAGSQALAAEMGGAGLLDALVDLDLYVFHDDEGDGFDMDDLVDFSEIGNSLFVFDPAPGAYRISVVGFEADPVAVFDLTTWLINDPTPDDLSSPPG